MAVNLQAQILALRTALESALAGTSDEGRAPRLPWTPGQRLTAQVESELPRGRYQIRVATFQFDVELPVRAQVGDALRLEFLSASPRVAFALISDSGPETAQEGAWSARAQPVQISAAGRVLTAALQSDPSAARSASALPAPIEDPVPLLPGPPSATAMLAAALQRAMDRSGLFYESHLMQWFAGGRPLAALLQEPQGRLSAAGQPAPLGGQDSDAEPVRSPATPALEAGVPRTPPGQPRSGAELFDAQTLAQIRSQLDVIEHRQIVWHGQGWPGQQLEWRIEEPPEHDPTGAEPVPWTTHLRLTLPRLGEVSAELSLSAGHVRVRLAAEDGTAAAALGSAQGTLGEALEQAGLMLSAFSVTTDESA
jgi:flagellar hook-length control protein FliK